MRRWLPLAVALLLAGMLTLLCCTPSVHPLYTQDDLIFEPSLLGSWLSTSVDEDDGEVTHESWVFSCQGYEKSGTIPSNKVYMLDHTDSEGGSGCFLAWLVRLGDELFIDAYPLINDEEEQDWLTIGTKIPAHIFIYLEQLEPAPVMRMFDRGWLENYVEANPDSIDFEYMEGNDYDILLTAETPELQAFVLKHLDEWATGSPITLERVTEEEQAEPETE